MRRRVRQRRPRRRAHRGAGDCRRERGATRIRRQEQRTIRQTARVQRRRPHPARRSRQDEGTMARADNPDVPDETQRIRGRRGRHGHAPRRAHAGWRDAPPVAAASPIAAARTRRRPQGFVPLRRDQHGRRVAVHAPRRGCHVRALRIRAAQRGQGRREPHGRSRRSRASRRRRRGSRAVLRFSRRRSEQRAGAPTRHAAAPRAATAALPVPDAVDAEVRGCRGVQRKHPARVVASSRHSRRSRGHRGGGERVRAGGARGTRARRGCERTRRRGQGERARRGARA